MLTGGIAAAFILYCANQNRIEKRIRANRGFSRGLEIGVARGFAAVGDEDDDMAAFPFLRGEAFGAEDDGVVNGRACTGSNSADSVLENGDFIGVIGDASDVFVETENGEAIARSNDLLDEMSGGGALGGHFDLRAEAGVNHEREVERLLCFPFENFDFLRIAFLGDLEGFDGKIGRRAIVFVEDADKNVDQIDPYLDRGAALNRIVGGGNGVLGLGGFAGRGLVLLRPGRAVRVLLRCARMRKSSGEQAEADGGTQGCGRH